MIEEGENMKIRLIGRVDRALVVFGWGAVLISFSATSASATVRYVDAGATGANNGTSWPNAYTHLQSGLAAAVAGDEIWVADGTYMPDGGRTPTGGAHVNGTGNQSATFQLKSGVAIYGGFRGASNPPPSLPNGETDLSQRNVAANSPATLSGDLSGDDGTNFANNGENCRNVLTGTGVDSTAVLDGFIVEGGNANGPQVPPASNTCGGGMLISTDGVVGSSPTVANCTFRGNNASTGDSGVGAGVYIENHPQNQVTISPMIVNCRFIGNHAGTGGGIYTGPQTTTTIVNCTFTGNYARECPWGAGAIAASVRAGFVRIVNCTVVGNGAAGCIGGGIAYEAESPDRLVISNCILWGNTAGNGSIATQVAQISAWPDSQSGQFDCTLSYSCIQGWTGSLSGTCTGGTCPNGQGRAWTGSLCFTGNIGSDPMFVNSADPDGSDNMFCTGDDGLRLQANSPCIDTGTITPPGGLLATDICGQPRIMGCTVDMGAYERQSQSVCGGSVVGRHIFYNNSFFDSATTACNNLVGQTCNDKTAIATDKTALLPGVPATTTNYISFDKSINGIMVDIASPGNLANIGADDFQFRVGNDANPCAWTLAAAPIDVIRSPGAGDNHSDRVTIIWVNNAIPNRSWLQVTVLSNPDTGLPANDVHYWGIEIGEGLTPSGARAIVSSTDEIGARNHPHNSLNRVQVASNSTYGNPANLPDVRYDYNRDSLVSSTDEIIARNNPANSLTALLLITPP